MSLVQPNAVEEHLNGEAQALVEERFELDAGTVSALDGDRSECEGIDLQLGAGDLATVSTLDGDRSEGLDPIFNSELGGFRFVPVFTA